MSHGPDRSSPVNPYAPPLAAIAAPDPGPEAFDLRLFLRWERLRLLYNAILAAVTAVTLLMVRPAVAGPRPRGVGYLVVSLLACWIGANICFCLGPVLDGYARLAGLRHRAVTAVVFLIGTGVAVLLALMAVHGMRAGAID